MLEILTDKTICITRGDIANIVAGAKLKNGEPYTFKPGDVVRFSVFKKNDYSSVVIRKDVKVQENATSVTVDLLSSNTRIGNIINKPVDYWYEVVLNPDTAPQTLIGFDKAGEKIFRLYPEGGDGE